MKTILATALIGLLAAGILAAGQAPQVKRPEDVQKAETVVRAWLRSLKGKTKNEIETMLGNGAEQLTWDYKDRKELLMRFRNPDHGWLALYFFDGKVVKSSVLFFND